MKKDKIYSQIDGGKDFTFNSQVAEVFDDMVNRSIPNYQSILQGIVLIAQRYLSEKSNFYDLGCSLGSVTLLVRQVMEQQKNKLQDLTFIAVDLSPAMVERAKLKIGSYKSSYPLEINVGDITRQTIDNAGMVVLNFVLQFLQPEQRYQILSKIYHGLKNNGVLVLSEKVESSQLLIDLHHDFKASQGYSQLEIERKRQALENVMQLDSFDHHLSRLKQIGFSKVEVWQQSYNFVSFIAIK